MTPRIFTVKTLLALFAGCALPFSLAPFNLYLFSFISPAILLWIWLRSTTKQAFWSGWLFGLGFFGVGTSWIYISIHQFGNAPIFLAAMLTGLVIVIVSFYFAFFGFIFKGLSNHNFYILASHYGAILKTFLNRKYSTYKIKYACAFSQSKRFNLAPYCALKCKSYDLTGPKRFFSSLSDVKNCLLVFPALWVLTELARSYLLTGLPWNLLGYAQLNTPLSAFAPIFGIYGLSLITTLISGALVLLITQKKYAIKVIACCIVFGWMGLGFVFYHHAWTKADGKPIQVSVIQGNIPQTIKWNQNYLIQNINIYKQLTFEHFNSQLIVWPEGAFPFYPQEAAQFIRELSQLAAAHHSNIIFGAPIYHEQTKKYYNGMLLIGENQGQYLKKHLVPFGEYTPLHFIFGKLLTYFNIPMSDFSAGPSHQKHLTVNHIRIAPFICFEIIFPNQVLDAAEQSELLLSISDDSWFGKSIALSQQLAMSQMRSLETGRYQIVSTNTGISAILSPFGIIEKTAPVDQRVVVTAPVTPMSGKTPLMKWRYYPVYLMIIVMLVCAILF